MINKSLNYGNIKIERKIESKSFADGIRNGSCPKYVATSKSIAHVLEASEAKNHRRTNDFTSKIDSTAEAQQSDFFIHEKQWSKLSEDLLRKSDNHIHNPAKLNLTAWENHIKQEYNVNSERKSFISNDSERCEVCVPEHQIGLEMECCSKSVKPSVPLLPLNTCKQCIGALAQMNESNNSMECMHVQSMGPPNEGGYSFMLGRNENTQCFNHNIPCQSVNKPHVSIVSACLKSLGIVSPTQVSPTHCHSKSRKSINTRSYTNVKDNKYLMSPASSNGRIPEQFSSSQSGPYYTPTSSLRPSPTTIITSHGKFSESNNNYSRSPQASRVERKSQQPLITASQHSAFLIMFLLLLLIPNGIKCSSDTRVGIEEEEEGKVTSCKILMTSLNHT